MRLNNWTIGILLVVLCQGCIEPFEPDVEEAAEVMVINGRLSDNEEIQTISISESSHYNNPRFRPVSAIPGATGTRPCRLCLLAGNHRQPAASYSSAVFLPHGPV